MGAFAIWLVLSTGQKNTTGGNNKNKHGCGNYEIKIYVCVGDICDIWFIGFIGLARCLTQWACVKAEIFYSKYENNL